MTTEIETTNNSQPEVYALDLDWDLISHLALPESIHFLRGEQFTEELIEDPLTRKVFTWQMEHYRVHNVGATGSVLEDQFDEVRIEEPQTTVGDLVERIRTRYMRNKGRDIARNIATAVNEDPLGAPKLMLRGGRELADLVVKRGEVFGTGDYHRLMALYDSSLNKGAGPSLGYKELDDHFNGQLGVTFLIGPPKSYKSWYGVNAIRKMIKEGKFPYIYSLELESSEYTHRLHHLTANVPYWRYLKKVIDPIDRKALKEASDFLDSTGIYKIEKPDPGERGIQRMVERALNAGASCVVIDQLQYVENRKGVNLGTANNTGDYWEVCNDMRDYSDEIPIFCIHQFNRSVMNAKEMPEAQQAKGSAAVEEVATLALGLWANKEMRRSNVVEVGTLASRNYGLEAWRLGVELSHGCSLDMIGVVDDEDEDE